MATYILKQDLVIRAGTRFSPAPAKTERAGAGHIEAVFGLSPNTCGIVEYSLDPTSGDDLSAWFEEEKPVADLSDGKTLADAVAEAVKIVESAQSNPTTVRAFGREFTAEGFLDFCLDFAALSRIWHDYTGETPNEWWRKFGTSRRAVVTNVVRCVSIRNGGV